MNAQAARTIDPATQKNIQSWLDSDYDEETKETIRRMQETAVDQLIDAFYTTLSFGTGGMRGLMGIGSNRMNVYTVRAATQGLANYILQQPIPSGLKTHRVMIGYDSRNNSKEFAEEAAKVLAGNGIEAHLFDTLHPTPLVSFGCRLRHCTAGIMVTASHNPPAYNGYKVYWNDGAQVLPPHDAAIIAEVKKISSPSQVKSISELPNPLVVPEGNDIDANYLAAITELQLYPEENHKFGKKLKIIYSPLHGTGIYLVPEALKRWGFHDVHLVKEQAIPNGLFPTVELPNPEDPEALKLGIHELQKLHADIFLATDPDADRVGVAVEHHGQVHLLTGNQVAALCLNHVIDALKTQQRLPKNAACVKTLPTTELFAAIAKQNNVTCFDVLTGFKYIAEKIREWENDPKHPYTFIFGGEDSYGYLIGTHSRDKDAVVLCALISEIALHAKLQNKTLIDRLEEIYAKYGHYLEGLLSINFPETKEGKEKMVSSMATLRANPPLALNGHKVIDIEDYQQCEKTTLVDGKKTPLTLPKSDVLLFRLENDGKLIVRPSGTEPKIKIYAALKDTSQAAVDELMQEIKKLLQ